jgi:hypothetical protein
VRELRGREIGDRTTNRFGWDFRPFLLAEPELRSCDGQKLWAVLVERNGGMIFSKQVAAKSCPSR